MRARKLPASITLQRAATTCKHTICSFRTWNRLPPYLGDCEVAVLTAVIHGDKLFIKQKCLLAPKLQLNNPSRHRNNIGRHTLVANRTSSSSPLSNCLFVIMSLPFLRRHLFRLKSQKQLYISQLHISTIALYRTSTCSYVVVDGPAITALAVSSGKIKSLRDIDCNSPSMNTFICCLAAQHTNDTHCELSPSPT